MPEPRKEFLAGVMTLREFGMQEPLPLSKIQEAIFDFLRGRTDAVVFGAQAVNVYVEEPRMSQDIDLQSTRAEELAGEIRSHLFDQFHIATRIRSVAGGHGFRIYQIHQDGNRHLVDLRSVKELPPHREYKEIMIATPEELIAGKAISYHRRRNQPKSGTDLRDLMMLLIAFPHLKSPTGEVSIRLAELEAEGEVLDLWKEIVEKEFVPEQEEDEFL